jgi:L-alanine-DL-glutamate epimerase-like enolase superfamily enzyme
MRITRFETFLCTYTFDVPKRPGLGIEADASSVAEEALQRYPFTENGICALA